MRSTSRCWCWTSAKEGTSPMAVIHFTAFKAALLLGAIVIAPASEAPTAPSGSPFPPEVRSDSSDSIGWARMARGGTIHLHLRPPSRWAQEERLLATVPWSSPEELIGYGDVELDPKDQHYFDVLRHLGGLRPGETKPVPDWRADEQWHCALDPERGSCPLHHPLPERQAS